MRFRFTLPPASACFRTAGKTHNPETCTLMSLGRVHFCLSPDKRNKKATILYHRFRFTLPPTSAFFCNAGKRLYNKCFRKIFRGFSVNSHIRLREPVHIHAQSKANRAKRYRAQCARDSPSEQLLWKLLSAPLLLISMLELAHMNESHDSYMNDDAVGVTVLKDCFVVSLSCVFPLLYYLPFLCYLHILHYSPLLYSSLSFILPSLVFFPLLYYLPLLYSLPLLHDFPLLLLPLLYSLLESRRRCHLNTARCACVETLYILHCYILFVSYMLYILHFILYFIYPRLYSQAETF